MNHLTLGLLLGAWLDAGFNLSPRKWWMDWTLLGLDMVGLVSRKDVKSNESRLGWLVMGIWPSDEFSCSCDAYWYWDVDGTVYACVRLGIVEGTFGASGYCAGVDNRPCDRLGERVDDASVVVYALEMVELEDECGEVMACSVDAVASD